MEHVVELFVAGIVLIILGSISAVLVYNMMPVQIQAQNDLLNAEVSGVTLSTQQSNLITNLGNVNILMYILIPTLLIISGIIVILYGVFEGKGK
jgi:hypothetical protein